ncbi:MAG: hypothetical protein LBD91_02240 [Prevotellaceae bacterium]|nr:hypothetical protein [Prevotellaceae bacterium]
MRYILVVKPRQDGSLIAQVKKFPDDVFTQGTGVAECKENTVDALETPREDRREIYYK